MKAFNWVVEALRNQNWSWRSKDYKNGRFDNKSDCKYKTCTNCKKYFEKYQQDWNFDIAVVTETTVELLAFNVDQQKTKKKLKKEDYMVECLSIFFNCT